MESIHSIIFNSSFQAVGLLIALSIGIILLMVKPYWAFLFATLIVLAFPISTLAFTRVESLGPYFNLYDACLLISVLACVMDRESKLVLPFPLLVIFSILLIALITSFATLGVTYGVLKALRQAISWPIQFVLTACLVRNEKRVKSLLIIIFLGALAAELQHLFLVVKVSRVVADPDLLRSVQFGMGGSEVWLLAGPYLVGGLIPHPLLQMAAGAIFLLANLSGQTRSIAFGFMGALVVYYLWLVKGPNAHRWHRFKLFAPVMIAAFGFLAISGLTNITGTYAERLAKTHSKNAVAAGLATREKDFRIEFNDWLKGNILIGNGLNYYEKYATGKKGVGGQGVAWGHLGYITYLSQTGLLGFVVFGFWFPLVMLKRARRIIKLPQVSPVVLHLALLAGASFIINPLIFTMSGSYLGRLYLPGLLGGALWNLSMNPMQVTVSEPQTEVSNADRCHAKA